MDRTKVFAIGFHRTGTTSLAAFLEAMGLRSIHYPSVVGEVEYEKQAVALAGDKEAVTELLKPVLSNFDAFADVPFPGLHRQLFARYPDAKFILMMRDPDEWWSSLSSHWNLNRAPRVLNPFERIQYQDYLPGLKTVTAGDRELIKDAHRRHILACRSFFPSSSLCEVDLADPEKSEIIARFVGILTQEFPHVNKSRARRSDRVRRIFGKLSFRG